MTIPQDHLLGFRQNLSVRCRVGEVGVNASGTERWCIGAGDGDRTRDLELGKLRLYQLSYARSTGSGFYNGRRKGAIPGPRTADHYES